MLGRILRRGNKLTALKSGCATTRHGTLRVSDKETVPKKTAQLATFGLFTKDG